MREPVVADIMGRKMITAVMDTPFRELACALLAGDLGAVPVIDSSGRPIGIVTDADLATKLERTAAGRTCRPCRSAPAPGLAAAKPRRPPPPRS